MQFDSIKGALAIVLTSLLWGTTGVSASFTTQLSPLAIGAFAMGVSGILLVFTARQSLLRDYPLLLTQFKLVLLGALCVVIYPLTFYSSMRFAGVAIGTMISIATAPLFAAILERLFCHRSISTQWFVSFIFGAIGIVLLALGKAPIDNAIKAHSTTHIIGIALGLMAGLSYAGYSWVTKQLIDKGINSKSAVASQFGCAATILLPSLWFTGDNLFADQNNTLVLLYIAIVPMFIGYLLFGYGLRSINASHATLITLIEPLFATLLAVVLVGERFLNIAWIGMFMICLCLIVQSLSIKTIRDSSF